MNASNTSCCTILYIILIPSNESFECPEYVTACVIRTPQSPDDDSCGEKHIATEQESLNHALFPTVCLKLVSHPLSLYQLAELTRACAISIDFSSC